MRLFRILLHLYPAAFRNEYGEQMCNLFAVRKQNFALWTETIFDVATNAAAAHWDLLRQDLRYAARSIRRMPGFAATVILVTGLGVGANTAVFTIADHVLIRPLPFPDADRLVRMWEAPPGYRMELSPLNYRDWKSMSTSFEAMGAYRGLSVNLVGVGEPQRLEGASVTADLFPLLGVSPLFGRRFSAADDVDGAPGTVILSHGLWQSNFGGDLGVLGQKVLLDNTPYNVIGVMPPYFHFPRREAALWTPMRFAPAEFRDRNDNYLDAVARLKTGVTFEQAREEMKAIAARLEQQYPVENARTGAVVIRLRDQVSAQSRMLLGALAGAGLCVLLIACTNLANLLLARALVRRKEIAVRTSLGAGRERLVRQLLTESLVLAVCGAAVGLFAAHIGVPLLARLVPQTLPIGEASIDIRVLAFTALLTVATGLGFGVLPAIRACGDASATALQEGSRSGVGGRRDRLRSSLVIVEVAISVVLLISAGLLVRALARIQATDPGFRAGGVLTVRTSLPMPKYDENASRQQFYERVLSQVRQLPGVSKAGYTSFLPMTMGGGIFPVSVGGEVRKRDEAHTASLRFVTPGFLDTMGIPLRMGRDVTESDTLESLPVAVVSESFVARYWPKENPLGRRFGFAFQERAVVGVVRDIRVRGLQRTSEPQVYLPSKQVRDGALTWYAPKDLAIRTEVDPFSLAPAVRRIIHSVDSGQPVSDVRTLEDIVGADTAPRRVQVRVLAIFAGVAILLAGIGIHGLLSFTVSHRAPEFGVRIALGARSVDILGLVLRESFLLTAVGLVVGGALGLAAGRSIETLLLGVKPGDAATWLTAAGLALTMATAGSLIPAIRAVRVDPVTAIRAE